MKCFLFLLGIVLLALTVWTHRSRVGQALKVATIAYLVLIVLNVFRFADDEQSLINVGLLLTGALLLWGLGWLLVSFIVRRQEAKRRKPRTPGDLDSHRFDA
ncbi:MAG: hypothetical protein ACYC4L_16490 [Chloroflexota bacterium]